jgi:amphi-Trp domain-containing protein
MAELSWERSGTRAEAAALLRRVADGLEAGGEVELEQDGTRLAIGVPDSIVVQVEAEVDAETGASELEVELKWSARKAAASSRAGAAKKS